MSDAQSELKTVQHTEDLVKYLILESVGTKPHLETAGEIALSLLDKGHEVTFVFVGRDLPWIDCGLPDWLKWLGCSLEKRETKFEQVIAARGVRVVGPPSLPTGVSQSCQNFADKFSGGLSDLKQYHYANVPLGLGCASSLISWYQDSHFNPAAHREKTRKALMAAAITYERAVSLVRSEKPDKVITFNGRFATCRPIVEAAMAMGVPLLRHERATLLEKYDLFEESIHSYGYIRNRINAAWQQADIEKREEIGHSYFIRRRGKEGFGWFSCVVGQVQGMIPPRSPGVRRVVYFSSTDDEYMAVSDTAGHPYWHSQFDAVDDLVKVCGDMENVELVVRIHPWLMTRPQKERARWDRFRGRNILQIAADSQVDSYALVDSADVVVTYGSTIGIEAAYWGKPSILLGPARYAGLGVCHEPKTTEELSKFLQDAKNLTAPPHAQSQSLQFGYYHLSHGMPYRFYKPESKFEGTFLGDRLSWYPWPIRILEALGARKLYHQISIWSGWRHPNA